MIIDIVNIVKEDITREYEALNIPAYGNIKSKLPIFTTKPAATGNMLNPVFFTADPPTFTI